MMAREVTVLIEADASEPWQGWLAQEALALVDGEKRCRQSRTSRTLRT